ncbi:WecB/TagA/CpsF family glycosyltransferase [Mageeibacillus indolicus]|uniref:WecB/TagA/CpsF family glycosyltransferase n=1 Tax=Mageeibacillus indolicus TaxID=884684 RepID=UPI00068BE042|nr:WecB/TagA/CpsF family glycosyltransferase [Mageeibacillus indolicus]
MRKDQRKAITFTALHLQHGGVELAITQQANYLAAEGYKVRIICTYYLGEPAYHLAPEVEICYLTDRRPNRSELGAALRARRPFSVLREAYRAAVTLYLKRQTMVKAIKAVENGVIVSTRHEHSILVSRYGRSGVQKVAQLHHDHRFDPKLLRGFQHHYRNIDDFVLLLPSLKAELEPLIRPYNSSIRLHAIGNCLHMDPGKMPAQSTSLTAVKRHNHLVWVGRLSPEKGVLRLLPIAEGLRRLLLADMAAGSSSRAEVEPLFVIDVYGDGQEMAELKREIAAADLSEFFVLHGMRNREEILAALAQSKVMLLTSHTEGFSFVILEAASMGAPILAYDVRMAPRDLVKNGETGFLIKDDDAEEMAAAAAKLLTEPATIDILQPGLAAMGEAYSEKKIMERWMELFALGPVKAPGSVKVRSDKMREYFEKLYDKTMAELVPELLKRLEQELPPVLVVTANPEILMLGQRLPSYDGILRDPETLIVADGIGVVKAAKMLGLPSLTRIPGVELVEKLLAALAPRRGKIFLYGAKPEVMEALLTKIKQAYPDLQIVGAYHGYGQNEAVLQAEIAATQPDLVLAALGAPRQETFLAQCRKSLSQGILIGVGGSFDVISGQKRRAPKIWRKLNLEWAYRLLHEPKRLGRFVRNNLGFLGQVWRTRLTGDELYR